jgi:hypothetical protein
VDSVQHNIIMLTYSRVDRVQHNIIILTYTERTVSNIILLYQHTEERTVSSILLLRQHAESRNVSNIILLCYHTESRTVSNIMPLERINRSTSPYTQLFNSSTEIYAVGIRLLCRQFRSPSIAQCGLCHACCAAARRFVLLTQIRAAYWHAMWDAAWKF